MALGDTRATLHQVATHILARRRHAVTGRFGLRASPGGIATPAFGDGPDVIRIAGGYLIHEFGGDARAVAIDGSTLRTLAAVAGADLDSPFSCGPDTPALADPGAALHLDGADAAVLAEWWDLGWRVLDEVTATLGVPSGTVQLWPEHFDAATTVEVGGTKANIGFSPGDAFSAEPYVYFGPWGPERPGDATYWNAPFGAVLAYQQVRGRAEAGAVCGAFLRIGFDRIKERA